MAIEARQFEIAPAVRKAVGLLIGLVGPSSSGKTYSALRLATGIQRISGGDIDVIDTENGRALYYADKFKFNHMRFGAPFSPDDYLEAIRFCARRGSKTILIDSMSHEHEGPGGVLEWHERETERLATLWGVSKEKAQMAAWAAPKKSRRRLINEVLQLNVNLIMTFRAKEKIKIVSGKNPVELGWQPICGDEFMYEMVLQALLMPGSEGRPSWTPEMPAERAMIKLPLQFRELFGKPESSQLSEQVGESLARWAAGGVKDNPEIETLIADYAKCAHINDLGSLEARRKALWTKSLSATLKTRLKEAADDATARLNRSAPVDSVGWITLDQVTVLRDEIAAGRIDESLVLASLQVGRLDEIQREDYEKSRAIIERLGAEGAKK